MAVARALDVPDEAIHRALLRFEGIARRSQVLGDLRRSVASRMLLIDDYGHHPREIAATFGSDPRRMAGPAPARVLPAAPPHPHPYLFKDFTRVLSLPDALVLFDTYAAGEAPIPDSDTASLCRAVRARGRVDPLHLGVPSELLPVLPGLVRDGDIVLTLGAGSIGALAPLSCCASLAPSGGVRSDADGP